MLPILQFMFGGFWISLSSLFVIYMVLFFGVNGIVKIYARTLRFLGILVRGYPKTPNMDADGDIVLPNKNEI